jgi:acetyl-CoA carboxylase carboxyl transferase subunit alpha
MKKRLTAWECMEIIRLKGRPTVNDYFPLLFDEFFEMHGDRFFGDDKAIIGGIARFNGIPVTVIGQVKGKDLEGNKHTNFAMSHPEGYRKALRLMKQAEKFNRPIICFIDTPGAFCGIGAEERGQGEAIAKNMYEMMLIKTPIVSIVLGEGGSGGALALAVCDELAMLENALYSVISPRGCASILWKDGSREKEAANMLKITSYDLQKLEVAETIIPEPEGGAHIDVNVMADNIKAYLNEILPKLIKKKKDILLTDRYEKFRKIGEFCE